MEAKSYIMQLESLDKTGFEKPGDVAPLDFFKRMPILDSISKEISKKLGVEVDLDGYIQDATYYACIFVDMQTENMWKKKHPNSKFPEEHFSKSLENGDRIRYLVSTYVIFSKFGNLVAIIPNEKHSRFFDYDANNLVRRLSEILELNGFNVVPNDLLDSRYTGIHKGFKTWYQRFFDYY